MLKGLGKRDVLYEYDQQLVNVQDDSQYSHEVEDEYYDESSDEFYSQDMDDEEVYYEEMGKFNEEGDPSPEQYDSQYYIAQQPPYQQHSMV